MQNVIHSVHCLTLMRNSFFRFVVTPFGLFCGLKNERPRKAPTNNILEKEYRHKKNPNRTLIRVYYHLFIPFNIMIL